MSAVLRLPPVHPAGAWDALRAHILSAERDVTELPASAAPIDVNWDFYGVIS
jgi:hypothetical protein